VLGGVVLLFVILLGAAGLKSWRDLTAAQAREKQLESRIESAHSGIDRLRGRIDRLRSDPATLERLAREDLGLVEPRDVVIELPRTIPGGAVQPAAAAPSAAPAAGAPSTPPAAGAGAAARQPAAGISAPAPPRAASPPGAG
jgi:cell division protein FtsB